MNQLIAKIKSLLATHPQLAEIFRFAFTGGVCFVVEFLCLTLLVELLHVPVLLATAIAFLISVAVNYVLCVKWVFTGAKDGGAGVKATFLITSGMGFVLNEVFMWLMNIVLGIHYMIAKVISTLLVMIWNYFTKRMVLKRG
ncbi:MAG: GtrA family protein [Clostridia bacterium]|nr:GtrA family protein [Clostridia bacterium]